MALQQIANTDISSTGTFALGSVSSSALTSSRITFATTGGLLTDSAALTFNGTILTSVGFAGALSGTVGATSPSTVVATSVTNSGLTSGRVTYASTGGLLTDSANLTFSGTSFQVIGAVYVGNGQSSATFGGTTSAAGGTTDKDLTLSAWYPTSGTNDYGGDLYLSAGRAIGNGSGKLGSVYIKVGSAGATSSTAGSLVNAYVAQDTAQNWYISGTAKLTLNSTTLHTANGVNLSVGHTSTGGATFGVANGGNEIFQVFAAFSSNLNLVQNYNYASSVYVANENRASLYSWKIGTTEAMRITSAGLVGIGATSPSYKLSIKGDSATSNNILLTHDTDTTGAYSRIRFQFAEGNTSIASEIRNIQRVNGQNGASLGLYTDSTAGTLTQRMLIDYDGNVGIGTDSPSSRLDIVRSSTSTTGFAEPQMRVINTGTATLNQRVDIGMRWQDGTYNGIGGISMLRESATARSGSLMFSSIASDGNGLAAMHIKSTGKVGIGIDSPNANLQVTSDSFPVLKVADGVGGGAIALGDSTISSNYVGIWRGAANSISGGGFLNIQGNNIAFMSTDAVFGSATRTMTLDNNGNLLVGTTSVTANYKFVTSLSADTAAGMMIENTSNTVSAMAVMRYKNSGSVFAVTGLSSPTRAVYSTLGPNVLAMYTGDTAGMTFMVDANGPITFATGSSNAERMRISSDGTVNIGNPPPGGTTAEGNLVVAGSLGTGAGTASTRIQINAYETVSGVASGLWFGALTNETTGVIGSRTATGNIAFQTYNGGWAERMRLTYTGYLGIGETSPQTKLHMTDGTLRIDGVVANAIYIRGAATVKPYITINEYGVRSWNVGAGVYSSGSFSIQSNDVNGVYLGGTATAWASASDERLKDIIEPITDALTKVNGLRSVIGKYKTDEEGVRRSFLIAQDIQAHFPEALESSDPDKLGVQYTDVIPLLVSAIKEQQALIESMAAKLKDAGVAGF
jgi:hypothetical protein